MSILKRFFSFWYNFIVGDDWLLAAGVVVALIVTRLISHNYWFLLPIVILGSLVISLLKATRSKPR